MKLPPTNHLDLDMREALSMALQTFEGALVIVSHDRHMLRASANQFWLVHNQTVTDFDGDLEDYRRWTIEQNTQQRSAIPGSKVSQQDKKIYHF